MLIVQQAAFAAALLDPDAPLPPQAVAHHGQPPNRRFAVYRNNVIAGLIDALRAKFPATARIVGDEFFAAMARVYIARHLPRSKILHEYGDDFGAFIDTFEPATSLPYLGDVARLEDARIRAYHAADAVPLAPEFFQAIDPGDIGDMRCKLHPSFALIRSLHPVVTIWAMNAGEMPLRAIEDEGGEDAIIVRPESTVLVRALPPGGADFLAMLSEGATLSVAATHALACAPHFDLTANLAGLIQSGLVIACDKGARS